MSIYISCHLSVDEQLITITVYLKIEYNIVYHNLLILISHYLITQCQKVRVIRNTFFITYSVFDIDYCGSDTSVLYLIVDVYL